MGALARADHSFFGAGQFVRKIFFLVLIAELSLAAIGECSKNALSVLSPFTSQTQCVDRWIDKTALVFLERDCLPCQEMVTDLAKNTSPFRQYQVQVVILETDPRECLREAIRIQKKTSWEVMGCSTREAAQKTWQIESTPTLFWTENKVQKVQVGVF